MVEQDIGVASGWEDLGEDDRNSTVAFFKGGARCVVETNGAERGDEVLIWQGVPKLVEEGEDAPYEITVFDGYDEDEVPDGADYIVTTLKNDRDAPVNGRFVQNIGEARDAAREEVQKVTNGEY